MAEAPNFRDHLPSLSYTENKRKWMYPQIIKGNLYQFRDKFSYFLLLLLFSGPFIKINGEQLILLNIIERKFVFFGVIFWPQDFYLFVLAILTFMVFIVMFTAIFGRVWCGWACPQTIFMEMVFRKVENWIEGDYIHQQKLDTAPLSLERILKKGAKHFIFQSESIPQDLYRSGSSHLCSILSFHISESWCVQLFVRMEGFRAYSSTTRV
jgi:hypothetical protein